MMRTRPRSAEGAAEHDGLRTLTRRLNLACGRDVREGWVNVDLSPYPGVIAADLQKFPWRFAPAGSFDHIEIAHYMEHVPRGEPFLRTMEELHRLLAPGGTLLVRVPHFDDIRTVWRDPTHQGPIYPDTWAHFDPDEAGVATWYSSARFRLVSAEATVWRVRDGGWRIRGHSIYAHIHDRIPFLRRFVLIPCEMTYTLRAEGPREVEEEERLPPGAQN